MTSIMNWVYKNFIFYQSQLSSLIYKYLVSIELFRHSCCNGIQTITATSAKENDLKVLNNSALDCRIDL